MTQNGSSWADKIRSKGEEIRSTSNLEQVQKCEHELFGRKAGLVTLAMKEVRDLSQEERKELNMLKKECVELIEAKTKELSMPSNDQMSKNKIDVTLDLPEEERGHLHLIPEFMRQAEEVFGRMGFDVAYGPEIEEEELNFDLLNIPKDHPARDTQDTFWVKGGKKVLRTQTSPVQIRYMRKHKPPFRMICLGKVYRKDADATHSPMFHQLEGLMIGKDVSLANMKAVMLTAVRELMGRDVEYRFRTGFFPFVEPGLEMDIRWQGEDKTKEGDWLEVVGCGMVHPNVLKNVKIDPEKWQGFAFGFGIDRLVMIKHQIPSIKHLFEGDLRFLKQF